MPPPPLTPLSTSMYISGFTTFQVFIFVPPDGCMCYITPSLILSDLGPAEIHGILRVNPLTTGTDYIRYLHFYYFISAFNMLKTKRDIKSAIICQI